MLYNFAAGSFYVMKLCSRLFVLHCRSHPKYDRARHFDPHFEEVGGGVEPWSIVVGLGQFRPEFLIGPELSRPRPITAQATPRPANHRSGHALIGFQEPGLGIRVGCQDAARRYYRPLCKLLLRL